MEIRGVTDSLAEHLRDSIITGEFLPGSRLNEADLASQLGVSRAPIREAFRVLENDNLIVRKPRHGTYVADLTIGALEKVYQARKMIETFAIDHFQIKKIRHLPKAEKALMKASNLSLPSFENKDEMVKYVFSFADFHIGLIQETKNEWIIRFYQSITYSLARYQFICLFIPGLTANSFEMHEKILKEISKGKYAKAKSTLLEHIDRTAALINKRLEEGLLAESERRRNRNIDVLQISS